MSNSNASALLASLTPSEREICTAFALRIFNEINTGRLALARPGQCHEPEKLIETKALMDLAYCIQDVIYLTSGDTKSVLDELLGGLK